MRYFDNSAAMEDAVQDAPKYGSTKTGALHVTPGFDFRGSLPECVALPTDRRAVEVVVYSYDTPIGWRVNGIWYVPNVQYSITTTKHQEHLQRVAGRKAGRLVKVDAEPTEQDAERGWYVNTRYGTRLHLRGVGKSPYGPRMGW